MGPSEPSAGPGTREPTRFTPDSADLLPRLKTEVQVEIALAISTTPISTPAAPTLPNSPFSTITTNRSRGCQKPFVKEIPPEMPGAPLERPALA